MMDQRFWQQKKKHAFRNVSNVVIPAYAPLVFYGSPQFEFTDGETLLNDRTAYPVYDNIANKGRASGLFLINGPQDVQPDSYGEASRDYPLPCLVDENSFPIWNGSFNSPLTLGSFQEYAASASSAAYFPILGLHVANSATVNAWRPASFSPELPLWTVLHWDVEPDGSQATNRVVVVERAESEFPVAGGYNFQFLSGEVGSSGVELVAPFPIISDGLYEFNVSAEVEIRAVDTPVIMRLGYIQGPNVPNAVDAGANSPPQASFNPESNEVTSYINQAGRRMPKFRAIRDDNNPYTNPDPEDKIEYDAYGYETVSFQGQVFAFKEDKIKLDVACLGQPATVVVTHGTLNFRRVGNAMHGNPNAVGYLGWHNGYPWSWGSGWYGGYGWGWNGWYW